MRTQFPKESVSFDGGLELRNINELLYLWYRLCLITLYMYVCRIEEAVIVES